MTPFSPPAIEDPAAGQRSLAERVRDYLVLGKFRLSLLVVFSASLAYLTATGGAVDGRKFFWLVVASVLITLAANAYNQIIEVDTDRLMRRTADRPLAAERLSIAHGQDYVSLSGGLGMCVLFWQFGWTAGVLGMASFFVYAWVYTPLKKQSPLAVPVGAVPGALPVIIGWAAAAPLDASAWTLFVLQFLWQFPHFWAIAWVLDDDYKQAGFRLLPDTAGRTAGSARWIVLSAVLLIPAGMVPYIWGGFSLWAALLCVGLGLGFATVVLPMLRKPSVAAARRVMFGSFLYLPLMQLVLLFDRLL